MKHTNFALTLSILFATSLSALAKPPPPAPRTFQNLMLTGKCKDGSHVRASIKEKEDKLYLARENCKNLKKPQLLNFLAPEGDNYLEANFIIFKDKIFEDISLNEEAQSALLYCRLENVKAVLRNFPSQKDRYQLSVSEVKGNEANWVAVLATKEEMVYSGKGDLTPRDQVTLKLHDNDLADLDYAFEVKVGKVGDRPLAKGSVKNLRCYRP